MGSNCGDRVRGLDRWKTRAYFGNARVDPYKRAIVIGRLRPHPSPILLDSVHSVHSAHYRTGFRRKKKTPDSHRSVRDTL